MSDTTECLETVVRREAEEGTIQKVPPDVEARRELLHGFEAKARLHGQPGKNDGLGSTVGPARLGVTAVVVVVGPAERVRIVWPDARQVAVRIVGATDARVGLDAVDVAE